MELVFLILPLQFLLCWKISTVDLRLVPSGSLREPILPLRIQTALLFLIAAPLGMLGWIGVALMRSEELSARRQVVSLAEGRLLELVRAIDDAMSNQHRQVKQQMEQEGKLPERLMILERKEPHLRRSLWVSARGQLLYPPAPSSNVDNEYLIYNELTMLARQRPPVPNSRTLDQMVSQLRNRIERDPKNPRIVQTVYGAGYRDEPDEADLP